MNLAVLNLRQERSQDGPAAKTALLRGRRKVAFAAFCWNPLSLLSDESASACNHWKGQTELTSMIFPIILGIVLGATKVASGTAIAVIVPAIIIRTAVELAAPKSPITGTESNHALYLKSFGAPRGGDRFDYMLQSCLFLIPPAIGTYYLTQCLLRYPIFS